jgi:hypothetical protein
MPERVELRLRFPVKTRKRGNAYLSSCPEMDFHFQEARFRALFAKEARS